MSVIIRLQNLPWNASALDIRRFFHGLSIPDGGVHIIGGEKGDVFIAFSTDEDARQGMMLTGERLNDVPVRLFLSSKTEMQNVIASARTVPVVMKNKDDLFNRPPPPIGVVGRNDEFHGPGFSESRGIGFPEITNMRNPGSLPPPPMFGGSLGGGVPNLDRDRDFNQSSGFNGQRGSNSGGFNQIGQTQMNSNRAGLNAMAPPNQSGFNQLGEGNRPGFNRSGGRLLEEVKPVPARLPAPPSQGRSTFDSSFDSGPRNGNSRVDKPMGEVLDMNPSRTPQFGDLRDNGQFSSDQSIGGSWGQSIEKRDAGRMGSAFNDKLKMDRDLTRQEFNRFDDNIRDSPLNIDSSNRFSQGGDFNNGMDVGGGRSRFNENNQEFGGRFKERMDIGSRGDERDLKMGRRDSFRDRESFDLGRVPFGMADQDELSRNDGGFHRDNPVMPLPVHRRGPGLTSDFNHAEGYGDQEDFRDSNDFAPRGLRPFQGGRSFGSEERRRPLDEQEPGRSFGGPVPGRTFGLPAPGRAFGGQEQERNALWSAEPMDDFDGGRLGRNGERKIPSLMSPRGYQLHRTNIGMGGTGSDWCVRMTNLPLTFHYRDVRRVFATCDIPKDGIKLINNKFGERTGEAFVRFDRENGYSSCLAMNNRMVDGRKVRIEPCLARDFTNAVDNFRPPRGAGTDRSNVGRSRSPLNRSALPVKTHDLCVLIKKMPLKTTVAEVRKFLGNVQLTPTGGPYLELDKMNQPRGAAVVELVKEKDYNDVLLLNGHTMGRTSVVVHGISKNEFDEKSQAARHEAEVMNTNNDKESEKAKKDFVEKAKDSTVKQVDTKVKESVAKRSDANEETCVQLSGLSWDVTNQDIVDFFRNMKIVKDGIYLVRSRDGKPSGTAYVEFASEADKKRGLLKYKHYLGKRYVDITSIMRKQMLDKIKDSKDRRGGGGDVEEVIVLSEDDSTNKSKAEHTIRMQNLHSDTQLEDIMDFFQGLHPIVDSIKLQYKDGKPTGDGLISFQSSQEAGKALSTFNRRSMLGQRVTLTVWPKK